jgi:hypothetical protein
MFKTLLATLLFLSCAFLAMAQKPDSLVKAKTDTVLKKPEPVIKKTDTVARNSFAPKIKKEKTYHPDSTHIPSLAVKRSLMVPGWGQVYNHRLWKVPLIYVGLGFLGKAVVDNQKLFKQFLAMARIKSRGDLPTKPGDLYFEEYDRYKAAYDRYAAAGVTETQLQDAASNYQRNMQISVLSILLVWGVQAVDAYIDAKFISAYTVDNNLSMKVAPSLINQPMYAGNFNSAFIPGIKITFTL